MNEGDVDTNLRAKGSGVVGGVEGKDMRGTETRCQQSNGLFTLCYERTEKPPELPTHPVTHTERGHHNLFMRLQSPQDMNARESTYKLTSPQTASFCFNLRERGGGASAAWWYLEIRVVP